MDEKNYMKNGQRYEQKAWPMPIAVKTHHQGYVLQTGDTEYMYGSVPELIKGLAVHAGLKQEDAMSTEELDRLVEGIINGEALTQALAEVVELKKVIKTLNKEIKKLEKNEKLSRD